MTEPRSPAAEYLRFLVWAVAVAGLVAALSWVPTRRLAGEDAVPAMLVGCALALFASLVGGIPVARSRRSPTPAARVTATMAAMGLRFGVLLALGLAMALSGGFERTPLLLGAAVSYLALLAVDTWYAVKGF
jgi:hypothetical protein